MRELLLIVTQSRKFVLSNPRFSLHDFLYPPFICLKQSDPQFLFQEIKFLRKLFKEEVLEIL